MESNSRSRIADSIGWRRKERTVVIDTSKITKNLVSANWPTTVAGFAAGLSVEISEYMKNGAIHFKDPVVYTGLLLWFLGYLAKGRNVTGGTTPNSTNDPAAVAATATPKA